MTFSQFLAAAQDAVQQALQSARTDTSSIGPALDHAIDSVRAAGRELPDDKSSLFTVMVDVLVRLADYIPGRPLNHWQSWGTRDLECILNQLRACAFSPSQQHLTEAVLVWRFEEAPEKLQALSNHGGDEDWLAYIPANKSGRYFGWMDTGSAFGCCDVQEVTLPDGAVVRIGAHA